MKRKQNFAHSTGVGDLHLTSLLTQMAIGYKPQGIIADELFPIVRVGKQSDMYTVWNRQQALSIEDAIRAPGTEARKITRSVSSGTFYAKNYALKTELTLEDRVNMDPALATQLIAGRGDYLMGKLMLAWDVRASNLVNSTANVGSSASPSSSWAGAGNPLGNVYSAIDAVRYRTGYRPNKLVFGPKAWDSISRDISVRNLIFGVNNGGGYPSLEQVKNIFAVDNVLLAGGFYSASNEAQPENVQTTWADNVLVAYVPPGPSIDNPSFGYSFRWVGGGLPELNVEVHPFDDKIKSEEVEIGYYQDEKVTAPEYGFLITSVNSNH